MKYVWGSAAINSARSSMLIRTTSAPISSRNRAINTPPTLNAGVPYDLASSTLSSASAILRIASNVTGIVKQFYLRTACLDANP